MSSQYWQQLKTFKNAKILQALEKLPQVLAASRQHNTIKAYLGAYRRFEEWAGDIEELSVFPSNELAITIYLLSLVQARKSVATIQQFVFAASWLHSTGGFANPTTSPMVKTILDGAKRTMARPSTRKEPISPRILKKILKHLMQKPNGMKLKDKRSISFMVLAFAGFFRCEEALRLRRNDIAFHSSYLAVFIESSKTDILRNGRTVLIARTGTTLDPVAMLYQYLQAANIPANSTRYIFRAISKPRKGKQECLRVSDKHLSYTTIKEDILHLIQAIGLDPKRYGTHSLRADGATAAANQGTSERLFKVHGRWRSDNSKDRYVRDSIHRRLKVTLNLGL